MDAEFMAKLFHDIYEELAPKFNYKTRKASAKSWFEIPENNRKLMIAVAERILVVQKKQAEENCIEDCAVVDSNKWLVRTVAMLNSMVLSGESYSEVSKKEVECVLRENKRFEPFDED